MTLWIRTPSFARFYLVKNLYEHTDEDHYLITPQLMEILEKEYSLKTHCIF